MQKAIADTMAQFSDVAVTDMAVGVDGCARADLWHHRECDGACLRETGLASGEFR